MFRYKRIIIYDDPLGSKMMTL